MTHQFTNRLINESSPYLLQHAHNPVDWYAWGDEALQKAKAEDKIILVSIGYAACHWCHVMEKESFENEIVAKQMNDNFINIKIDREERPDLDHVYMDAVQAITGSGGWPLNVFLTPDAKPFYGGTYFPPVKAYNRSSWPEVLTALAQSWREKRGEIESQADNLVGHLQQANNFGQILAPVNDTVFTKDNCYSITENILKQADKEWGGFGKAPKFPQTFTIQYLLQYHYYTKDTAALNQALLSVDKMLEGGIYDHVGGGFARYSTDNEWLAPHFEKMLYDNALLLNIICDAYQVTQDKKYEGAIRKTISFVQRELMDKQGGFYAALDADSEGEEGKFYVWTKNEIDTILGDDAPLFCEFFDVSEKGNWEGNNILRTLKNEAVFVAGKGLEKEQFAATINKCLQQLLTERNKRIRPITDDKILLGWNALMITALCKSAAALHDEEYKNLAVTTIDFLLQKFKKNTAGFECLHTYKNGLAKYPAFLDDYAYLVQACIQLQEITSNTNYLDFAKEITQLVIDNFMDADTGYFFFTHQGQEDIILRKKEVYDGATPSGNSVMAENLFYLAVVFDNRVWYTMAEKITASLAAAIVKYPTSFGIWASLLLKNTLGINELVIAGKNFNSLRDQLLQLYLPGKIVQAAANENKRYPMLTGKTAGNETFFYLCRQYNCKTPVNTLEALMKQITEE
ncbi:thioredoxin domain-containing protein [Ferruginibacter sp. SUN106]|uniref:thioredoxin domain-containing protein n=1 Tax=Ferruginibacter sp. SUN106 TaxID=2978348 RepID=UPI003D369D78